MTKKVIVGFDGSDAAREAAAWAASEASTLGAPVRIVACYENPAMYTGWGYAPMSPIAELAEITQREVASVEADIRADHPDLEITNDVGAGALVATILDGTHPNDLVVLGASARHGAGAFWLGSTPRAVVHHAECPVVVVRGAAWERTDRIVVGIDGSDTSTDALIWACDEADLHHVPLMIVHAWEYPYVDARADNRTAHDVVRVDARRVLDNAVETARERCGADVEGTLRESSPRAALLSVMHDGDLVVVGSHGRSALAAGILGSTANALLDQATAPVVVVRPQPAR